MGQFLFGKGRKRRVTPLTRLTSEAMKVWLSERGSPADQRSSLTAYRGEKPSRDGKECVFPRNLPRALGESCRLFQLKLPPLSGVGKWFFQCKWNLFAITFSLRRHRTSFTDGSGYLLVKCRGGGAWSARSRPFSSSSATSAAFG